MGAGEVLANIVWPAGPGVMATLSAAQVSALASPAPRTKLASGKGRWYDISVLLNITYTASGPSHYQWQLLCQYRENDISTGEFRVENRGTFR